MSQKNLKVDEFLKRSDQWRDEFSKLRKIVHDPRLTEELKWGQPCYTFEGKNVVLMHGFKEYCALLFFKGALLKDQKGILVTQTENVQAGRQLRFTSAREIVAMTPTVKAYVDEVIEVEKSGLKVSLKKTTDFTMPSEFKVVLDEDPALKTAFQALTPGRQRGYLLHFSSAKQSKTRISRIEKCKKLILKGKGLDD